MFVDYYMIMMLMMMMMMLAHTGVRIIIQQSSITRMSNTSNNNPVASSPPSPSSRPNQTVFGVCRRVDIFHDSRAFVLFEAARVHEREPSAERGAMAHCGSDFAAR